MAADEREWAVAGCGVLHRESVIVAACADSFNTEEE
jgi:hypothetical protein